MKIFTIPNFFTLCNLLCGCLACVLSAKYRFETAFFLILIGIFFDFFDGFAARLLNSKSAIGLQLDSLADVISFGLAPSILLFYAAEPYFFRLGNISIVPYAAFLIAAFSALRLAKFNVDTRQSDSFIGLPTPANALLIASVATIVNKYNLLLLFNNYSANVLLFLIFIALSCFLLVSEIPMFSMKIKTYGLRENISRYLLLFIAVLLLVCLKISAFPIIVLCYIAMSVILNFLKSNSPQHK